MSKSISIELSSMGLCKTKDRYQNSVERNSGRYILNSTIESFGYKVKGFSNYRLLTKEERVKQTLVIKSLESLTLGIPTDAVVKVKETLTGVHFYFIF